MFSTGAQYGKLKTNLRLAISRLKLQEKKKTELALKARKEIADYIVDGKYERAKIRVEHIIREDYIVEAMELVEMYCDLLLGRFGLIQQMKTLDDGLAEAVSSLIWAAPRLQTYAAELKIISDHLTLKYGKTYAHACRENSMNSVNEKLVHKLNIQAPPKILVEKYMIEIARSHNISYEPDIDVMANEEKAAEALSLDDTLINFGDEVLNPPEAGFIIAGRNVHENPFPGIQHPPPLQPKPFDYPPKPFDYPPITKEMEAMGSTKPTPPLPSMPPSDPHPGYNTNNIGFNIDAAVPSYESVVGPHKPPRFVNPMIPGIPKPPGSSQNFNSDVLPELPSVPNSVLPDLEVNDDKNEVDFDDLAKRFEELKKKK